MSNVTIKITSSLLTILRRSSPSRSFVQAENEVWLKMSIREKRRGSSQRGHDAPLCLAVRERLRESRRAATFCRTVGNRVSEHSLLPTPHHRRHFPYRIVRTFVRSFILASLTRATWFLSRCPLSLSLSLLLSPPD